jgi:hypothetical protein
MEVDPEVEIAARSGDGTSFFPVPKEEDLRTTTIAAFEVHYSTSFIRNVESKNARLPFLKCPDSRDKARLLFLNHS